MRVLGDLVSILRLHIVGIAMAAALAFGWLFTGRYLVLIALVGGLDWCVINLLNRATDIDEDLANGIRGTESVARHKRLFLLGTFALMGASFVATHLVWPALTPLRLFVQAVGTAYSIPLVPTPRGLRRIKEIYFAKNFMSAALFVCTVFLYPLAENGWESRLPGGAATVACLALFFLAFEITYEVIYDMRDLEGDRAAGIPTYPVAHGMDGAHRIVLALLALSAAILVGGLAAGLLGLREGLMLAAPAVQWAFYRPRFARGLTPRDCILMTDLGTGLLLAYLAGTRAWLALGLPENVYLRS